MEPISIALGLAQILGPKVAGWFGGENAEAVATQVVGIAQAVTGIDDPLRAAEAIKADPALALDFKTQVLDREHELKKLAFADRQDARQMYIQKHQLADYVAKHIMRFSPLLLLALVALNIGVLFLEVETAVVLAIGNLLGMVIQAVLQAMRTIIEFLFGGSLSADPHASEGLPSGPP